MKLAQLLEGKRVCIVAGSGGVGKTTTSAAVALGLAAQGARVAVVTIDPARRLADSLGVTQLGNEPAQVDPALFAAEGLQLRGELWAMMLDPKRTLDELIARLAPDAGARERIYSNPVYQGLSSAVAGSQEFSAITKLYELHQSGRFDVIVLDTPPSRNALDFLDAPTRLTQFFDGRALRLMLAPSGLATRLLGRGTGIVFGLLGRLTGADLLADLHAFFGALAGVIDGFRERAAGIEALLLEATVTFLIVTTPETAAVEEAIFFHSRLREAAMPFGGLIVSRALPPELADVDPAVALAAIDPHLDSDLSQRVTSTLQNFKQLALRDRASLRRLAALGEPLLVPDLGAGVHEVGALVALERVLFSR